MVSKQVRMPTRLLKALENGQFGQQPDAITPSAKKKNEKGKNAWDGGQITRRTTRKAGHPLLFTSPSDAFSRLTCARVCRGHPGRA